MNQVYIFDFGDKIKVGFSTNVEKRLRTIELSSGVEARKVYSVNAGRSVEKLMHKRLENRLIGEFFAFPFDEAKDILDEIMVDQKEANENGNPIGPSWGDKLRIAMQRQNVSITVLAERTNQSCQNLSNKFSRGNFSEREMRELANAIGCEFEPVFHLKDGSIL